MNIVQPLLVMRVTRAESQREFWHESPSPFAELVSEALKGRMHADRDFPPVSTARMARVGFRCRTADLPLGLIANVSQLVGFFHFARGAREGSQAA